MRLIQYALFFLSLGIVYLLAINWHVVSLARLTQGFSVRVSIDNKDYFVKNTRITQDGKTLEWILNSHNRTQAKQIYSLAIFYRLTREEPLFVPHTFPIEELKESLMLLEHSESLVRQETSTKDHIVPIDFFKSLTEVVKREKIFLAKPTVTNAESLISAYKVSTALYKEHARKSQATMEKTINETVGKDKEIKLVELANVTTSRVILEDYQKIIENATLLEKEINKRQACLQSGSSCNTPKPIQQIVLPPPSKQSLLPKDILFPGIAEQEIRGPYTAASSCFETEGNTTFLTHTFFLTTAEDILSVKLATNNFYRKLQERYPDDKILIDQGLIWVFQPETNTYICPNLEYLATLYEIDYTYRKRSALLPKSIPSTIPLAVRQQLQEASIIENAFFNTESPSEVALYRLATTYYNTYQKLRIWKVEFPQDVFIQSLDNTVFLDTALAILYKTSAYPMLINKIASELDLLYQRRTLFESRFNMIYLHGIRSSYSLTYLIFSPGTWVSPAKPIYLLESKQDAFGWDKRYITHRQLREKYSEAEIKTWHNRQKENSE